MPCSLVEFLRPLYLGESIAPFRVLDALTAVIPWDDDAGVLLDRDAAQARGSVFLSAWLRWVQDLWAEHGKRKEPLVPRLDYFGQLSAQLPGFRSESFTGRPGPFRPRPCAAMPKRSSNTSSTGQRPTKMRRGISRRS